MLFAWIEIEAALRPTRTAPPHHNDKYRFQADDMRIALFFLFFVQIAFFGTGK
jgi:phosphatidylinositol glycan class N